MFTKHKTQDSPLNFRKIPEIAASNIELFSSYAQIGLNFVLQRVALHGLLCCVLILFQV